MKKLYSILLALYFTTLFFQPWQASAQSPEKLKYQAVIRDSNGHVVTDQAIGMQISILQGDLPGTVVYTETQSLLSNAHGLTSTEIGAGTVVLGDFSTIDWATGPYFLQIETDPTGGTNYTVSGTNQLLSVPYALHSKTADSLNTNVHTLSDLDGNTKIQVEKNPNEDIVRFDLGGTEQWKMTGTRLEPQNSGGSVFIGDGAGANDDLSDNMNLAIGDSALFHNGVDGTFSENASKNVSLGYKSLYSNTTGYRNTAGGYNSLHTNTIGNRNTAFGANSLRQNATGDVNTAYGSSSLYSNSTGSANTAVGTQSLFYSTSGDNNTALGRYSMYQNTTGYANTASGTQALWQNTTGYYNTSMGYLSLSGNTSGHENTAIGTWALHSNSTASYNTAVGQQTLYTNTTGSDNTAFGYKTLYFNSTGDNNTASGYLALYDNTSGYENTAIGSYSFSNTTTAGRNVGVGYNAGVNNITGFYNTAVGWQCGPSTSDIKNSTALGRGATTTAWNQIRIGNNIISSIGGQVGWTTVSDKRFKKEIRDDVVGLDFIMALQPVSYQFNLEEMDRFTLKDKSKSSAAPATKEEMEFDNQSRIEAEQIRRSGFLAQDVEEAALATGYDFSGVDKPKNENDYYGLRYAEFVVPLVKAVQEQQLQIEQLQSLVDELTLKLERKE